MTVLPALAVAAVTTSPAPSPPAGGAADAAGDNPDHIGPGLVAFVFVVVLCAALFLLVRSMGRQIRRVRFDETGSRGGTDGVPIVATSPDGHGDGYADDHRPDDPGPDDPDPDPGDNSGGGGDGGGDGGGGDGGGGDGGGGGGD